MAKLAVTMACGPYDRMQALENGAVQPEGIDLTYVPIQSPPEIFARMVKTNAFDVSEMSLSMYMTLKARGHFPYIAIPVFPLRMFRHAFIFINKKAGIQAPKDLQGKRVGVMQYRQTAGLWIRGILQHEYGVDLGSISYFEGGVNAPRPPDEDLDLRPLKEIRIEHIGDQKNLNAMLEAGEIDAYFGARAPKAMKTNSAVVGRLFPDHRAVERAYYAKTGVFPIMHTLVMHEDFHDKHRWVAEAMFKACEKAKHWAIEQMRFSGALRFMLPWLLDEIDEMDQLFGANPWPYGIEANRATLEMMAQFLVDQHFVATKPAVDPLFAPIVSWAE
jgi:4,5-dihydroxyphthalate decarboxylase